MAGRGGEGEEEGGGREIGSDKSWLIWATYCLLDGKEMITKKTLHSHVFLWSFVMAIVISLFIVCFLEGECSVFLVRV